MAHRLLIVGAVALLVAGVGGAVIFLGDSQLETVKSTPVAGSASGAGVESEPTSPRPARSLPSEPPELSRLPAAPAAEDSIDAKTAPLGPVVKPDAAPATVAAVDAKSTTA